MEVVALEVSVLVTLEIAFVMLTVISMATVVKTLWTSVPDKV